MIQEIQSGEWWQDVTTTMLENVRKRLRALVKLIDKQKRKPIYTDFEDQMGGESAVDLPGFDVPDSFERFVPRRAPSSRNRRVESVKSVARLFRKSGVTHPA